MGLERTGLQLDLQGKQSFISGVQAARRASDQLHESFQRLSSSPTGLRSLKLDQVIPKESAARVADLRQKFDELTSTFMRLSPQAGGAMAQLAAMTSSLGRLAGAMSVATVGAAALGAALFALGMRGAAMPGVIQAFDVVTSRAGTLSSILLRDLRTAARGTVADMELMRKANLALAGAGPELAQALGPGGGLAGLMEIARAQAKATGQDVDFLFNSLVTGVKRSSPLLIDNTGLVLKVGEATERYAQSIGKTTEQLTAEERQIAILNATLEAGREAVETYGRSTLQASEYIARIQTTITNTLDRLALSVQPIFTMLTAVGDTIISAIAWPLQNIVVPIFYELANTIFGPLLTAFNLFRSAASDLIAPVLELIHRWVVVAVGALRYLGRAFQWIVQQAARLFAPVKDIVIKLIIEPFTKLLDPVSFAQAAGRTFGAYAEGIMWAANNLIFPAVIAIAQFIADFLMGFSPPKKGPLSNIDQGAANVMRAWLEGFTGVSLAPVSDMMGRVNALLGDIALMTHDQVTRLLQQLDEQLQPFIDNLEIAKAFAESVLEPLRQAETAMQRRLDAALRMFTKGGLDAEAVRALDRQNEALEQQKALWEGVTAEAEYQLALKKSEQAVLRALLAIQERRTKPESDLAQSAQKAAAALKAATGGAGGGGGGGAAEPAGVTGGVGGALPDLAASVGEFLGVTDEEIDRLFGDIGEAFMEGFMTPGVTRQMNEFIVNQMKLDTTIKRIGDSPGFQKITQMFEDVFGDGPNSVKTKVTVFATAFEETWNSLFGDSGVIVRTWDSFKSTITGKWNELFGEGGVFDQLSLDKFKDKFDAVFGGADVDGSILNRLNSARVEIETIINTDLPAIFDSFSLDNILETFRQVFGDESSGIRNILNWFRVKINAMFKIDEGGVLYGIFGRFSLDNILAIFESMFGIEEGGIRATLNSFVDKVKEVFSAGPGGRIYDVLAQVGGFLSSLILDPATTVANLFIDAFEKMINAVISGINFLMTTWNSLPFGSGLEFTPISPVRFGRIGQEARPMHATPIPGMAGGGVLGPGLAKVHGGEVLVQSARPFAVFPKRWVEAMDRLANAMVPARITGAPAPVVNVQGGGGGVTNYNTFNVHSQQSMRLAIARARAFGA